MKCDWHLGTAAENPVENFYKSGLQFAHSQNSQGGSTNIAFAHYNEYENLKKLNSYIKNTMKE